MSDAELAKRIKGLDMRCEFADIAEIAVREAQDGNLQRMLIALIALPEGLDREMAIDKIVKDLGEAKLQELEAITKGTEDAELKSQMLLALIPKSKNIKMEDVLESLKGAEEPHWMLSKITLAQVMMGKTDEALKTLDMMTRNGFKDPILSEIAIMQISVNPQLAFTLASGIKQNRIKNPTLAAIAFSQADVNKDFALKAAGKIDGHLKKKVLDKIRKGEVKSEDFLEMQQLAETEAHIGYFKSEGRKLVAKLLGNPTEAKPEGEE